jgi:CsoR family transcriptional regulator, copper-sensing transcriptional repressor
MLKPAVDYTPRGVYTVGMNTQKETIARRLNIIAGQVRGLREMVEKDTYCIDVITQSSAIKQGLSNVEDMLMEHHLSHCVVKQIKSGTPDKAVSEVLKVYKLKRK